MERNLETVPQLNPTPPASDVDGNPPPRGRIGRGVAFVRRLGAAGPLAVAQLVGPGVGGALLLGTITRVAPAVRHTGWGPPAAAAAFAGLGGAGLMPTAVLSVFAGWAFGFRVGLVTTLLGFAGAAAVSFAYSRWLTGRRALEVVDANPRWRAVHRALLHTGWVRGTLIIALLRLPSLPPFGATTVALAAMRARWGPFLVGTVLGTIPRTAAYVFLASRAERLNLNAADDWWMLLASSVAALAVLALLTWMARRVLATLTEAELPEGGKMVEGSAAVGPTTDPKDEPPQTG